MVDDPLLRIYRRPGFLIRRAHQIAVALFLEETDPLGVTPTQYGILLILSRSSGLDQISVAKLLGLDRSTTGMVIKKLEDDGLIKRSIQRRDRRKRTLSLTRKGRQMLMKLADPVRRAQEAALSPFSTAEAQLFLALLQKFTSTFNGTTRVPVVERLDPDEALAR